MYVTRVDVMASGGGAAYEAWAKQLGDMLKAQKGFQRRVVANSYGYPAKYTAFNRWESREAARASANSPEVRAFLQTTQGVLTLARPMEAYEIVASVGEAPAAGTFLVLAEWELDPRPGHAAAFESSRKELFELRQKHGKGFVSARLGRFLGNRTKYLVGTSYSNREVL